MHEESKKYAEYVQSYLEGLRKEVEIAVFPILTEDGNYSIKIHALDMQYKKSAIFTAYVPAERDWQMSLLTIKGQANKSFGYTVFY